jgi:hypothetical protein
MADLCNALHRWANQLPAFTFPFNNKDIPLNGIYLLFEHGETGHGARRIVRVGTHTGKDQLRSRLWQHFENENKDRSIFRKNIGRALLAKDNDPFLAQWELDLTTKDAKEKHSASIDFKKQETTEQHVSKRLQNSFSFVVVQVDDPAQRKLFESRIISTLSHCAACEPSSNWLGLHSPKQKIRESGLWLEQELYKEPLSAAEFDALQSLKAN